jgi:hypothetical protein
MRNPLIRRSSFRHQQIGSCRPGIFHPNQKQGSTSPLSFAVENTAQLPSGTKSLKGSTQLDYLRTCGMSYDSKLWSSSLRIRAQSLEIGNVLTRLYAPFLFRSLGNEQALCPSSRTSALWFVNLSDFLEADGGQLFGSELSHRIEKSQSSQ